MKVLCPFCESDNLQKIEIKERFPVPFCNDAIIRHEYYRCNVCEEEGDFANTVDDKLTEAIDKANLASAPALIDSLAQIGIKAAYFEKALRLPFRTTARWKRGEISYAGLALLRLIRFSPALLDVADDNFSETAQAKYHIMQPARFFDEKTTNNEYSFTLEHGSMDLNFHGELPTFFLDMESPNITQLNWEPVR